MKRKNWPIAAACLIAWSCSTGNDSGPTSNAGSTGGASSGSGSGSASGGSSGSSGGSSVDSSTVHPGDGSAAAADAPGSGGDSAGGADDASMSGDAPPVGLPGCMGLTSAAFCDDFEQQATGQPPQGAFQVNVGGGGAMTVETSKPYSGMKSVHIHVPQGSGGGGGDPTAQMHFTQQFPVAADDLHGRVMMYLTKNPNGMNNPNIHWDLTWTSAGGGIEYVLGSMWNPTANAGAFMPVYQPPDDSIDTSTPWPEAKWACIQWEFRHGGSGGDLLQIKLNGNVIDLGSQTASGLPISGGNIPGWPAGSWNDLVFGYVHYSSPTPIDVDIWFDDLAFGAQEVLCPPLHQ